MTGGIHLLSRANTAVALLNKMFMLCNEDSGTCSQSNHRPSHNKLLVVIYNKPEQLHGWSRLFAYGNAFAGVSISSTYLAEATEGELLPRVKQIAQCRPLPWVGIAHWLYLGAFLNMACQIGLYNEKTWFNKLVYNVNVLKGVNWYVRKINNTK